MTKVVLSILNMFSASSISISICVLTEEVTLSNIDVGTSFSIILAIDFLCFCPPEGLTLPHPVFRFNRLPILE